MLKEPFKERKNICFKRKNADRKQQQNFFDHLFHVTITIISGHLLCLLKVTYLTN